MSLEAKIAELTSAVQALTLAFNARYAERAVARLEPEEQAEAPAEVPNAESSTPASGEPSQPAPEQSSPEVTYDDVKKATNNLSAVKGKEVTIGVLSRFGVKRATELTREQWSPYIEHAGKVTRGEADA